MLSLSSRTLRRASTALLKPSRCIAPLVRLAPTSQSFPLLPASVHRAYKHSGASSKQKTEPITPSCESLEFPLEAFDNIPTPTIVAPKFHFSNSENVSKFADIVLHNLQRASDPHQQHTNKSQLIVHTQRDGIGKTHFGHNWNKITAEELKACLPEKSQEDIDKISNCITVRVDLSRFVLKAKTLKFTLREFVLWAIMNSIDDTLSLIKKVEYWHPRPVPEHSLFFPAIFNEINRSSLLSDVIMCAQNYIEHPLFIHIDEAGCILTYDQADTAQEKEILARFEIIWKELRHTSNVCGTTFYCTGDLLTNITQATYSRYNKEPKDGVIVNFSLSPMGVKEIEKITRASNLKLSTSELERLTYTIFKKTGGIPRFVLWALQFIEKECTRDPNYLDRALGAEFVDWIVKTHGGSELSLFKNWPSRLQPGNCILFSKRYLYLSLKFSSTRNAYFPFLEEFGAELTSININPRPWPNMEYSSITVAPLAEQSEAEREIQQSNIKKFFQSYSILTCNVADWNCLMEEACASKSTDIFYPNRKSPFIFDALMVLPAVENGTRTKRVLYWRFEREAEVTLNILRCELKKAIPAKPDNGRLTLIYVPARVPINIENHSKAKMIYDNANIPIAIQFKAKDLLAHKPSTTDVMLTVEEDLDLYNTSEEEKTAIRIAVRNKNASILPKCPGVEIVVLLEAGVDLLLSPSNANKYRGTV